MKAIVCKICSGSDFSHEDGVFVCAGCGMRYTVEDALELTVDVPDPPEAAEEAAGASEAAAEAPEAREPEGPSALEKLYEAARAARSADDAETAAECYEDVFRQDPNNWEAAFYGSFFRAKLCAPRQIRSACFAVSGAVSTSLNLIKTAVRDRQTQIYAVRDVALHAIQISNFLYDKAEESYEALDAGSRAKYKQDMLSNCGAARDILYSLGDCVEAVFGDHEELHAMSAVAWKTAVDRHAGMMDLYDYKAANKTKIEEYIPRIQRYDASYVPPDLREKKRGCYIATAVYGSYDCPEVWTLRRYRDGVLAKTLPGRAFIRLYYALSPTLVRLFGETVWFRRLGKARLDRMVRRLNEAGMEDTPYYDR